MAKILVADDEVHIVTLISAIFRSSGMEVITAHDGEDAVQKAKNCKPDLIISDIVMPRKNGFDVCKEIRGDSELMHTPVILLSALGSEFNKLNGFECGADDYLTKPFNVEELKARAKAILARVQRFSSDVHAHSGTVYEQNVEKSDLFATGTPSLDSVLGGGLPRGSNILVMGDVGSGKSSFARRFLAEGLLSNQKGLFVALDDSPKRIRPEMSRLLGKEVRSFEEGKLMAFVDAYSQGASDESYMLQGALELTQLSGIIADAGSELGQTIQVKGGGRRVIDSVSSLFINFELALAQNFVSQIARTALSFGSVTTLFVLEKGTVSEQTYNTIKFIMDGVIEFGQNEGKKGCRVLSMKWSQFKPDWVYLE